jgi:NAD(P)H-hydrate epimerase
MDQRTSEEFGIDSFTLMEIAGTKAADFILSETEPKSHGLFICGKGNNAGDALVVARIISEKGYTVTICLIDGSESLSKDTSKNLELLKKLNGNISFRDWNSKVNLNDFDFVVDGIFGTGLKSDVRTPYNEVIESINESDPTVFSLDLPSGLHADTGRIMGTAVKADFTIALGSLKTGFYLNEGFDVSGKIILCELPFPNQYRENAAYLIDEEWVNDADSSSKQRLHKYDGGVLYIIAGSEGLTGAATLASQSAWATGIGAVILITPKALLNIYEKTLIQIIKKPVGNSDDSFFSEEHISEVKAILAERPGKLLIGPGLGRDPKTVTFVQQLLSDCNKDVIIDADALYALSMQNNREKSFDDTNWILTPHPGELNLLLDSDISDDFDRLIQTSKEAKKSNVFIVSKGFPGIIGTNLGDTYLTGYDTRLFSRAGFGDILSGKIAGLFLSTQNPKLAILKALLDGKAKLTKHLNSSDDIPEPIDLI